MTDIVERLRSWTSPLEVHRGAPYQLAQEAADEIEQLRALLKECSDDLEAHINHHYRQTLDYPSQKLKFDGEMAAVIDARRLLSSDRHR